MDISNNTCTISANSISSGTITAPSTNTTSTYTINYLDPFSYYFNGYKYSLYPEKETKAQVTKTPIKHFPEYFDFKDIKEIVPKKVYEFTFYDDTKIKTVRDEEDIFDLEYMFSLALAKKLYSKKYTLEGVLFKACQIHLEKKYAKAIKKGIKLFNKLQEEKIKEKEKEAIKKRQHEKYIRKKKEAKQRKRKDQVNIIAEAIRLSKEEG